jgi:hypothetical protein
VLKNESQLLTFTLLLLFVIGFKALDFGGRDRHDDTGNVDGNCDCDCDGKTLLLPSLDPNEATNLSF